MPAPRPTEHRQEARAMRAAGHTINQIADQLRIAPCTASKWCRGVVCPVSTKTGGGARAQAIRQQKLAVMRSMARRLRRGGLATDQIARVLRVTPDTVNRWARGVERSETVSPALQHAGAVRVPLSVGELERLDPGLRRLNAKMIYAGLSREDRLAALRAEAARLGVLDGAEVRSWR